MISINRHSLLMSLGIVMAAITLLAFISISASLFISDTIQGKAKAINESGALRMRSYRIASSLVYELPDEQHWKSTKELVKEFEYHLNMLGLNHIMSIDEQHELRIAYHNIEHQWQDEIKPIFDIYLEGIEDESSASQLQMDMSISQDAVTNLRNRYFLIVPDFVENIDYLVSLLEYNVEEKVKRLKLYQFIALALTISLIITALYLVNKRVRIPLKLLLSGAERVRQRDFSFRTKYTAQDELGQLGFAFNTMSEDLSTMYTDLEKRVEKKTADLQRSKQSIELLYKTVKNLNEAASPAQTFPSILKDIESLTGLGRGAICLSHQNQDSATMLASTFHGDQFIKNICEKTQCKKCITEHDNYLIDREGTLSDNKNTMSISIRDKKHQYGVLIIELNKSDQIIEAWQQQLLESIAAHIGVAISIAKQEAESRRLSLMEERGVIARELHDSLAQSLTFMKIQVSRLQVLVKKDATSLDADNVIAELRIGLNSAYKELRELLTTFRLKIDGEDFNEALIKTVAEFNVRGETTIACDNQLTYCDLTPNEEIHVLQLIREALSNIVQHANASNALLTLQYALSGDLKVTIVDDGKGMPDDMERQHHYGLSIMKERANTLNGNLNIRNQSSGGTEIELIFSPYNKIAPINIKNKNVS